MSKLQLIPTQVLLKKRKTLVNVENTNKHADDHGDEGTTDNVDALNNNIVTDDSNKVAHDVLDSKQKKEIDIRLRSYQVN